jgi:glutathione S-transferase
LKISPNNKIPAIIDRDNGMSLMESGAILVYLAEKYGKFLPKDSIARAEVNEWLMWQMGGFGPILTGASFPAFQSGQIRLCRSAVSQRSGAALWCS